MSEIIKFIKIDMLSIKPYLTLKNALIFIGLGVFYSMVTSNLMIIFGVALLFVSLLSTYPFLVGDKTGIDSLYRVFGFKEKDCDWQICFQFSTGNYYSVGYNPSSVRSCSIYPDRKYLVDGRHGDSNLFNYQPINRLYPISVLF